MNIDFTIAAALIVVFAGIMHFKSHVKFIAIGVFVGLALIEVVGVEQYFGDEIGASIARAGLIAVPALVLGFNHTVDKRKTNLLRGMADALVFTLFFIASIVQTLPEAGQAAVMDQSQVGWWIMTSYPWILLGAAALILLDSIQHHTHTEKAKKKKK